MAVKDYKVMRVFLVLKGKIYREYEDIVEGFTDYILAEARGIDASLHVIVNLKRRQTVYSYKKQVAKAITASKGNLNPFLLKKDKAFRSDYADVLNKRLTSEDKVPSCVEAQKRDKNDVAFVVFSEEDSVVE